MLDYIVLIAILVTINSIVAIGLNIQLGYTGLVNLMSITCVAIGGYTTLVLCLPPASQTGVNIQYNDYILGLNMPFQNGVIAGMVVSECIGLIYGTIWMRR
jgi:branched-chain amino acid transport system permease protein